MVLVRILLVILLTVDLLMSLHTPVVVIPTADGDGDVMTVSGTATAEETDPSEVVVKKPMPSTTGVL